jgi:hypothetical protein
MVVGKDKIYKEFNVSKANLQAATRDALIFEAEGQIWGIKKGASQLQPFKIVGVPKDATVVKFGVDEVMFLQGTRYAMCWLNCQAASEGQT